MTDTLSNRMRALATRSESSEWRPYGDQVIDPDGDIVVRTQDLDEGETGAVRHIAAFDPAFVIELADLLEALDHEDLDKAADMMAALRDRLPRIESDRK